MRMVQNFLIIWFDANNNDLDQDFQRSLTILRRIVKRIDTFVHSDQCRLILLNQSKRFRYFLSSRILLDNSLCLRFMIDLKLSASIFSVETKRSISNGQMLGQKLECSRK